MAAELTEAAAKDNAKPSETIFNMAVSLLKRFAQFLAALRQAAGAEMNATLTNSKYAPAVAAPSDNPGA